MVINRHCNLLLVPNTAMVPPPIRVNETIFIRIARQNHQLESPEEIFSGQKSTCDANRRRSGRIWTAVHVSEQD